jgi:hypothetical protein
VAAIDHERVLLGLKAHIRSKRSHGQDELLQMIADLEVGSQLPEGQEGFDRRPVPRRAHRNGDEQHEHDPLDLVERDRAAVS